MLFQVLKFKISLESEYIKFEESTEFGGGSHTNLGILLDLGNFSAWRFFKVLGSFIDYSRQRFPQV